MGSMANNFSKVTLFILGLLAGAVHAQESKPDIDQRSYNLGILGGFAEVVRLGVKKLALSEALAPDDMDDLMADAAIIAARNEVMMWREKDLLVTDLYPENIAKGKHVLLIYTGDTLDRYLAIKADKAALINGGRYEGQAREEIARRFGRLLSYPDNVIDSLIAKQTE